MCAKPSFEIKHPSVAYSYCFYVNMSRLFSARFASLTASALKTCRLKSDINWAKSTSQSLLHEALALNFEVFAKSIRAHRQPESAFIYVIYKNNDIPNLGLIKLRRALI